MQRRGGYARGLAAVTEAGEILPAEICADLKRVPGAFVLVVVQLILPPTKMKRSKEVLLVAVALAAALIIPNVNAQEKNHRKGPGPGGERPGAERMMDELGLNADQAEKVKAIHEAERAQREAIRADASLSREQKMEKAKALRESTVQQVDAILTPEQRTKAQAMRAKMQERMKERRAKGDREGPPPAKH